MFIKSLVISSKDGVIRDLTFHKGLNLIVDDTPSKGKSTGNNVGKTTVLKLIDFCLGQEADVIYKDKESHGQVYDAVRNFLKNNEVEVTLLLVDNLDAPTESIEIKRNFLSSKTKSVCTINGLPIAKGKLADELRKMLYPNIQSSRPSFRQLIAHNVRYNELRLTNVLTWFEKHKVADVEDEQALLLYMFGCENKNADDRAQLVAELNAEQKFKSRLERKGTKSAYLTALDDIVRNIAKCDAQKSMLNINPEMDEDIQRLNVIKEQINHTRCEIEDLDAREEIINDSIAEFESDKFNVDLVALRQVYEQAQMFVPALHRSFEELVECHNHLQQNKINFIREELPNVIAQRTSLLTKQSGLRTLELELTEKVTKSDTFEDLEKIIQTLNDLYQKKGEFEAIIKQMEELDTEISSINASIMGIDEGLFSEDFRKYVRAQVGKFNVHFADISDELYGERYVMTDDVASYRNGPQHYVFSTMATNMSSGKKQGEISCFDIAYTKFADQEDIPCLHFILNDKCELVHNNQLQNLAHVVEKENVQYVMSILEDKLPAGLRNEADYVVKLSSNDKLFRF